LSFYNSEYLGFGIPECATDLSSEDRSSRFPEILATIYYTTRFRNPSENIPERAELDLFKS
jgi:hypothetical protein